MRPSVGLFYDAMDLLETCRDRDLTLAELGGEDARLDAAPLVSVVEFARQCGWVSIDSGRIKIEDPGQRLLQVPDYLQRLRKELAEYTLIHRPPWSLLIPRGAAEVRQALSLDELQCFREAGLFDPLTPGVSDWWDQLSGEIKGIQDVELLRVGRKGERFSIEYETKRTGRQPRWMSFESNSAGYDLLSIVSKSLPEDLRIEVKASEKPWAHAEAYISEQEWECAQSPGNHLFHLWLLNPPKILALEKDEMSRHMPSNRGGGRWTNTRIPFSAFKETRWVSP